MLRAALDIRIAAVARTDRAADGDFERRRRIAGPVDRHRVIGYARQLERQLARDDAAVGALLAIGMFAAGPPVKGLESYRASLIYKRHEAM